jgi:hypothetical protein
MTAPTYKTIQTIKMGITIIALSILNIHGSNKWLIGGIAIGLLLALSVYGWMYSKDKPEPTRRWILSRLIYLVIFLAIVFGAQWYWHSHGY